MHPESGGAIGLINLDREVGDAGADLGRDSRVALQQVAEERGVVADDFGTRAGQAQQLPTAVLSGTYRLNTWVPVFGHRCHFHSGENQLGKKLGRRVSPPEFFPSPIGLGNWGKTRPRVLSSFPSWRAGQLGFISPKLKRAFSMVPGSRKKWACGRQLGGACRRR